MVLTNERLGSYLGVVTCLECGTRFLFREDYSDNERFICVEQ